MGFFVRGDDGNAIGPVRYEQLVRGVAVQKIPIGTLVRREDSDEWQPVEVVVGLTAPKTNGESKKEHGDPPPRESTEKSYDDLRAVSSSLKTQALVLKVMGPILSLGSFLGAAKLFDRWGTDSMFGWGIIAIGVLAWMTLYSVGTLIGAGGDLLGALRDIARNTSRIR
jgi:hypothetical protein